MSEPNNRILEALRAHRRELRRRRPPSVYDRVLRRVREATERATPPERPKS